MKKLILLCALFATIVGNVAPARAAQSDTPVLIPSGSLTVTNDYEFTQLGAPLDYVVVRNTSAWSNTVTVSSFNAGVAVATLYSGDLAPGGSATVYPLRAVALGDVTNRPYTVSDVRAIVTAVNPAATNGVAGGAQVFLQSQ